MRALLPRQAGDRGAVCTQLVLVVPVLLLLMLLVVQFAVAWHARHVAQYTAQRALAAARSEEGSVAHGQAQARQSLAALGSRVLTAPSVTITRTATRTTVRVNGTVMKVVPGLTLRATGTATGPTERITTPTGGTP